ncbi:MAG: hypothetical protein KGN02_08180 [bacterium]|nr:hypothetical protein [bacterium]
MNLTDTVAIAIRELQDQFGATHVSYDDDGSGGAYVRIDNIELPAPYNSPTWLAFHIPFCIPSALIYPFFVRHDLRTDAFTHVAVREASWRATPATQISLKPKNASDPELETAVQRAIKVIAWLKAAA